MRLSKPINYLLTISILIVLIGCSSAEQKTTQDRSLKVSYVDFGYEQPTAKLMIEGMSCERMCVNAVKKSIATVPTVEINEMLFDSDAAVDTLIVHFDPAKVSEKELVKAVEDLAGGDTYQVKEIQLSKDAKTSCTRDRSKRTKKNNGDARQYTFTVPNPFEVLRKVAL